MTRGSRWIIAALVLLSGASAGAENLKSTRRFELPTGLEAVRVFDLDDDGAQELVLVLPEGVVTVLRHNVGAPASVPESTGERLLRHPERTLLALGDVLGEGGSAQLLELSPDGCLAHRLTDDGAGFEVEGIPLIKLLRGRLFDIRVGRPRFSRICSDLNSDGRLDVIVPGPDTLDIWLNEPNGNPGGPPNMVRRAQVVADLQSDRSFDTGALSDQLESVFRIPYLELKDVNGDQRPDLVVVEGDRRAFHLQREDGTLPDRPDRVLDLTIFRDTTPPAEIRPGRILAGVEDPRLEMTDLDLDGIPDYVISHRRKLWIFHGSADGPRFTEPTSILKTAEDVSAMLVHPLNADDFPDLLLLRLQVPSVAAIIGGFFSEFEIEVSATGYLSQAGRTFSGQPQYKGEITIRLPAIAKILKNPQAIIDRFESAASKFRQVIEGDFDGDGTEDVAMLTEDGSAIDIWRIETRPENRADVIGIRSLFFEDAKRQWTLDDVLVWLGSLAQQRTLKLTGGRPPQASIPIDPDRYVLLGFEPADMDGDGKADIALFRLDRTRNGAGQIDLYGLER